MKYRRPLWSRLSAVLLFGFATKIQAHTWVEELRIIAPNGTFVGAPGYPRGLVDREANVAVSELNQNQLPPNGRPSGNAFLPTDLMCKSSQMIGVQTAGNPALVASPGDQIALRYQENGHVTQPQIPQGRPEGSGTVFVYGTEKPLNSDTYLGIHRVWNTAGTGGDGRGVLLATRYFDDGQCYQVNNSPISVARQKQFPHTNSAQMNADLWCQTDVQIPTTATGNYTMYWVWEWPLLDNTGKVITNESYTSCMDIVVTPGSNSKVKAVNFAVGQDLNYAAIANQLSAQLLVNPTASLQTYNSAGPTPTFASPIASPTSSATGPSSSATGKIVTVTVTASGIAVTDTVTVTTTVDASNSISAHASPSTPTMTTSAKIATNSPVSTPQSSPAPPSANVPQIEPFLSPASAIIKALVQASTLGPRQEYRVRGRVVRT